MVKHTLFAASAAVLVVALLAGCGGGGGGGGSTGSDLIPPAAEPICSALARSQAVSSQGKFTQPNVLVPASTIERPADVGVRLHTDHLIYKAAASRAPLINGYTPAQIESAYGVSAGGSGAIAIVAAFHSATSLGDFNTFAGQFSLPTEHSGDPTLSTNPIFQVIYSAGVQPAVDTSWAQEIALDIEWSHAMAPNAKIYLVEAPSANISDLMDAVNVAKALPNVTQVSMSFGGTETGCAFASFDAVLVQNAVEFFAAAGDTAGERDFPALSQNAISVGGTSLTIVGGVRTKEKAWKDSGGSLSAFEPRPTFQDSVIGTLTGFRSGNDISADADPNTGVAVYTATKDSGLSGWLEIGGTSAATPMLAGIANSSGSARASSKILLGRIYGAIGTSAMTDITSGSNGIAATTGWDVPTGCGVPDGTTVF